MRTKSVKERLNLYIPKDLADELRRYIPARERTHFIATALNRELRRLKMKAAVRASAGVWKDEGHPEMTTSEDIDRWIEEERKSATRDWSEEWNRRD